MLTKIKAIRESIKNSSESINTNIKRFKAQINEKYQKNFPIPHLEKPTDHLLHKTQDTPSLGQALTTKKMVKFRLIGLGVVVLGYMMYISLSYLYMVIAAFILSLALEGCVVFWQRLTRSRGIGILLTYIIATIFVLSGFLVLIPFFFNRGTEILQSIMAGLLRIEASIMELGISGYINQIHRLPSFCKEGLIERVQEGNSNDLLIIIRDNIGNIMSTSSGYVKFIAGQALSIFGNIFGIIADFAILITLSVFFSIAHYDIKYLLKYFLHHLNSGISRIDAAYSGIAARLKNQIFLCLFIGITSYIGLFILERFGISIPKKGTLALIAGLLEIIPYLGPILGAIPAAISALFVSGGRGILAVIILYTIIQQFEEKVLVPIIMGRSLGVSPLLVFICMLFCGSIMGVLGILLAVPMSVIISLALNLPKPIETNEKDTMEQTKSIKKEKPPFKKIKISSRKN